RGAVFSGVAGKHCPDASQSNPNDPFIWQSPNGSGTKIRGRTGTEIVNAAEGFVNFCGTNRSDRCASLRVLSDAMPAKPPDSAIRNGSFHKTAASFLL
ncbi:MAG TPA: hypothetical protein PKY73_13730, partial [Hyphomonas sp.]|nr:hypothetical protein [Hyphomonas sp.]